MSLISCRHIRSANQHSPFFFYKMSIYFHIFGVIMLHWIMSNVYDRFIIIIYLHWLFPLDFEIIQNNFDPQKHANSFGNCSEFIALDFETTYYFLLLHVIRFPFKNIQYSKIYLLSTNDHAQSTSIYPLIYKRFLLWDLI